MSWFVVVSGHTALKAPDPIRTRKLSSARPGQYWGGGPPGKSLGCCWLFAPGYCIFQGLSSTANSKLPGACYAIIREHAKRQSQDQALTLITRRGKTEKSVFGFRAARCCNTDPEQSALGLKLILSFPPICGVGLVLLQSLLKAADED